MVSSLPRGLVLNSGRYPSFANSSTLIGQRTGLLVPRQEIPHSCQPLYLLEITNTSIKPKLDRTSKCRHTQYPKRYRLALCDNPWQSYMSSSAWQRKKSLTPIPSPIHSLAPPCPEVYTPNTTKSLTITTFWLFS